MFIIGPIHNEVTKENKIFIEISELDSKKTDEPNFKKFKSE